MQRALLSAELDTTFPFVLVSGYCRDNGAWGLILDSGWLVDRVVQMYRVKEKKRGARLQLAYIYSSSTESILRFLSTFPTLLVMDVLLKKPGKTLVGPRTVRFARALVYFLISTCGKAGDGSSSASSNTLLTVGPNL
jgi:hypothetical protein